MTAPMSPSRTKHNSTKWSQKRQIEFNYDPLNHNCPFIVKSMNGELAEAILVTPCQAEKTNNASSQTDFFQSSPEDAYNGSPSPKFNSTIFQKALQLE